LKLTILDLTLLAHGLNNTRGGISYLESKEKISLSLKLTPGESPGGQPDPMAEVERALDLGSLGTVALIFNPQSGCQSWPGELSGQVLALRDKIMKALVDARAEDAWERLPEDAKRKTLEQRHEQSGNEPGDTRGTA